MEKLKDKVEREKDSEWLKTEIERQKVHHVVDMINNRKPHKCEQWNTKCLTARISTFRASPQTEQSNRIGNRESNDVGNRAKNEADMRADFHTDRAYEEREKNSRSRFDDLVPFFLDDFEDEEIRTERHTIHKNILSIIENKTVFRVNLNEL